LETKIPLEIGSRIFFCDQDLIGSLWGRRDKTEGEALFRARKGGSIQEKGESTLDTVLGDPDTRNALDLFTTIPLISDPVGVAIDLSPFMNYSGFIPDVIIVVPPAVAVITTAYLTSKDLIYLR
jgi:hypothetical protein